MSLRTRAVPDGDGWVVEGQKVWSSFASDADFGLFLARSDPEAAKPHVGITMFILPMHDPAVTVRPLVDIAGGHHFNEVFVSGGASRPGAGPRRRERGVAGGVGHPRRRAIRVHGWVGRRASPTPTDRGRGAARPPILDPRGAAADRRRNRTSSASSSGCATGPSPASLADGNPAAGSLLKVAAGNLEQAVRGADRRISPGPHAQAWEPSDRDGDVVAHGLAASRQATIAGGTHQIQRNLLGERVLGLPR